MSGGLITDRPGSCCVRAVGTCQLVSSCHCLCSLTKLPQQIFQRLIRLHRFEYSTSVQHSFEPIFLLSIRFSLFLFYLKQPETPKVFCFSYFVKVHLVFHKKTELDQYRCFYLSESKKLFSTFAQRVPFGITLYFE